jgi:PAS domain S-box-containing protein
VEELALLRQAIDLTGVGFVLTDPAQPDNPIVYANHSFLTLTGYPREEIVGRNCRFLQGPDTDPDAVEELGRAIRAQRAATVELRNYRRDGSAFWNEVHIAPVRNEIGEVVRFVGVLVDVGHRREQRRLRAAAEAGERRSTFLAGAGPLLDASLDPRSTLDSLTKLSVPYLGDECVVYEIRYDEVRRIAATDDALVG